ncbi:hypothetical protein N4R57_13860 [Rhodobacteraceae bacterium D3-12]|nr:hypothetical protein N4R57_13860 [Rhodobacteraceae bacterium D3-12]
MQYAIPAACFVVGVLFGFMLGRKRAWLMLWLTAAAMMAVVIWQWIEAQGAQTGWDGIAMMLAIFFFLMPGVIGLLLGGAIAWWRARKRDDGQDDGQGAG